MTQNLKNWLKPRTGFTGAAVAAALLLTMPLAANVRDGVDAWSRGDYAGAVAQWEGPAAAGDPDAMFNLAQAYRLGRGVPSDLSYAEALYARAAQAGHVQAADTYGLMLFQDGRREQALPYVEGAARRGDPRAQYLLGIAHFNGDLVPRDWERAYALLTLANSEGLPQAAAAIVQMDSHIPLDQRQRAAGLAQQMVAEAESARNVELAQADLGTAMPIRSTPIDAGSASARVPRPIPTTAVSPSVAVARAAVADARGATGTNEAGATLARAPSVNPPTAAAPRDAAPTPAQASGPWRVQLGAFSVRANAERLWTSLSNRREIAGYQRLLIPAGRVTKLQAGGFATQAAAQSACQSLKNAGHDCIVTRS